MFPNPPDYQEVIFCSSYCVKLGKPPAEDRVLVPRNGKIVCTSRFVRVILAQGPC